MATVQLKFGSADHDRPVTPDDLESADYELGFNYEVIDGRLYVSPLANLPENILEEWLEEHLRAYVRTHPDVINYVTTKARVFVPGRKRLTVPEPDIAAYQGFPRHTPLGQLRWQDVSPTLVCEVLRGDPDKDLRRNVDLYFEVPSVREYWVLDARTDPDTPTLIQHRRYGKRWVVRDHPYSSTLTTKLLPGFTLLIDPRK